MQTDVYKPTHSVRFVTAASLFDGHDASINIMRRILQDTGAEVVHLGHNRSVDDVVTAAIQEDAQGIAVSSYQGGHMEYFKYMVDLLRERGAGHIRVYGGGGGTIVPREIRELHDYGVARIFSPDDGRDLGLQGMINLMMRECDQPTVDASFQLDEAKLRAQDHPSLAKLITFLETESVGSPARRQVMERLTDLAKDSDVPVLGVTGTGGAGKSSLTDELLRWMSLDYPEIPIAIVAMDPSKRRTGGALLGDRIRLNSLSHKNIMMRSMATRRSGSEMSKSATDVLTALKAAGFQFIILESSGIGQGDSQMTEVTDTTLYVMTPEYGASTQLEKIDMIDYASFIAINKSDSRGAEDAVRAVRKQFRRAHQDWTSPDEALPVVGTMAHRFDDRGVFDLYRMILKAMGDHIEGEPRLSQRIQPDSKAFVQHIIPPERTQYLRDIARQVREYKQGVNEEADKADHVQALSRAADHFEGDAAMQQRMREEYEKLLSNMAVWSRNFLDAWPALKASYQQPEMVVKVRDKEIHYHLYGESLSGSQIPRVAVPKISGWGDLVRWGGLENLPGAFPYTAGVFPFKRQDELPKRMFAGEGTPVRTNTRFHYLCKGEDFNRLSTAFDSVTLYGSDPDRRPDIYGKVGESGVSVCTLQCAQELYDGFDLTHPNTSVSMTINGPAAIILAFFFNTAIEQHAKQFEAQNGRAPNENERDQLRQDVLKVIRGTVQADILKEDQAQNTCIFSTEFSLKLMGDIQEYFAQNGVRNFYSVSISGYHIAEAGANPITQLALTLANGFTYVEYYLARGMNVDQFAHNLSFFFSNGLDPEYSVIGRVARRIWAIAMRNLYKANDRSQKLKYHIQTSGRSLHAQEIQFNDIRTTLQALMAIQDNTNSLHTNAYDEAITTPTAESVRRAMAIQLIIAKELGLSQNDNNLQGSFIIEELTELVEEAVLAEFERLSDRGGVLGAMELMYQRSKIQDESMKYESLKHSGDLPIIGVNTYRPETEGESDGFSADDLELTRATPDEKNSQVQRVQDTHSRFQTEGDEAIRRLQAAALEGRNIFEELMNAARYCTLGQMTEALYDVGGRYRRNM